MKDTRARKPRKIAKDKVVKSRRGRPRKANRKPNQKLESVKLFLREIKKDLKRLKKSKQKMVLLWNKTKKEQVGLIKDLDKSIKKLKVQLKKKKTVKAKRTGRKPVAKKSAVKNSAEKKRPGRKPRNKTALKKNLVQKPPKKRGKKPGSVKQQIVKPVSKPRQKKIKKVEANHIEKPETTEVTSAPENPGVSDMEPKKE